MVWITEYRKPILHGERRKRVGEVGCVFSEKVCIKESSAFVGFSTSKSVDERIGETIDIA